MAAPRKKKLEQPLLSPRPEPPVQSPIPEAGTPPKFLEYTPPLSHDRWQVERFDLLAAYFGFGQPWSEVMAQFHGFAEADTQRWFFVRRLFGAMPLIPAADAHPDDLRCFTREELCASMALKPDQLAEELTHLRVAWESWLAAADRTLSAQPKISEEVVKDSAAELQLGDELLKRFDFDRSLFEQVEEYVLSADTGEKAYKLRNKEKSRKEMDWFISKLMRPQWQKMLEEDHSGSLARTALVNELYLHRFDSEMMTLMPNTPRWKEMSKSRQEIEDQYQSQLADLKENFPELASSGRVTSRAIVSDMNLAHRQYYGHKENRLWDGVHTAAEIVFMMRTSAQLPVPRYRLGWQIMCVEARHGSLDPNFRSMLKKSDLKKLDRGFQRGYEEARQEEGDKQVDIERGVIPGEPNCDEFSDYLADEKPQLAPP